MRRLGLLTFGLALAGCHSTVATSVPPAASPAVAARRLVKAGMDPDASKIVRTPRQTTIEEIAAQKLPKAPLAQRVEGFETSTYQVSATIKSVQLKKDGDYYMVLKGSKGGTSVVEVPDPKTCVGSPMHEDIAKARKAIEERYKPTTDVKSVNDQAKITGVGFYGWGKPKKGATGYSGPRLMPGTGIEWPTG